MPLAQGNNTPTQPRIEPGSPDPESDALTIRPVRSPRSIHWTHAYSIATDETPQNVVSPSEAILLAHRNYIKKKHRTKKKKHPEIPENENGLIQMKRIGKSNRHI